ncbi:MAG: hypothetical protein H6668_12615 [Ardenticatenaceae bacterium]|nr:hypothetical protein [Ardenticatenaceae bacterium]
MDGHGALHFADQHRRLFAASNPMSQRRHNIGSSLWRWMMAMNLWKDAVYPAAYRRNLTCVPQPQDSYWMNTSPLSPF